MSGISYYVRVIWALARKDIRITCTEVVFLVTQVIIPPTYFLLVVPIVLASDRAPTAVVMNDTGPYAQQFYSALADAHSFRLWRSTAHDAQDQLAAGNIVAVVTIPADFDTRVRQHRPVQVDTQVNNLNTDFTEDARRAVPLAITTFYARAFPNQVPVIMQEHDVQAKDTDYLPYIGISVLVLGLAIAGGVQSGIGWSREGELLTMKTLLLSPAPRWCLILGKLWGAFLLALAQVALILAILIGPFGIRPVNWGEMMGYLVLTLISFCALGALLGSFVRQRRTITTTMLVSGVALFFMSGALGPVTFNTKVIEVMATLFPLSYAIAGEQHAFHGFNTNVFGAWNALFLAGFAALSLVSAIAVLRRTTVAQ